MLSDVVLKYSSVVELALYNRFRGFAGEGYSQPVVVAAATGICALDVCIDTAKFPLAAIENVVFAVLNSGGSCCFDECRLQDAYQNLKKAAAGAFIATPVAVVLSVPRFISHLCVTLPDPQNARPVHREAEVDSRIQSVIYPVRSDDKGPLIEGNPGHENVIPT